MKTVVINKCYGGFSLSELGFKRYQELGGDVEYCRLIPRDDPRLAKVVEELREAANGDCAKLRIVHISDDQPWEIDYYDGMESLVEPIVHLG